MKKIIWEFEWLGIKFDDLDTSLKFFRPPTKDFYSIFYNFFFNKYKNFDQLPNKWKKEKYETSKEVLKFLNKKMTILSVGSGIGYVEKSILELNSELLIDTYDFASSASIWLKEIDGVRIKKSIEKGDKYDFIFCTQLLYALSDIEINDFAKFLKSLLDENSLFLTVDTSINEAENGRASTTQNKFKEAISYLVRATYFFLFKKKQIQFWGWQRDNEEIINIFLKNGFYVEKKFSSFNQSFLLFAMKKGK